jgi:hypothetical protein
MPRHKHRDNFKKKLAFSAVFGGRNTKERIMRQALCLGVAMCIPLRLRWREAEVPGQELPTTPNADNAHDTHNPPPVAIGRAALAASGYAGAGAQVRFGETYELANDQSLRGTPTNSGMSYALVSTPPMQINFTSATMLTLNSQGQQYSLFDADRRFCF